MRETDPLSSPCGSTAVSGGASLPQAGADRETDRLAPVFQMMDEPVPGKLTVALISDCPRLARDFMNAAEADPFCVYEVLPFSAAAGLEALLAPGLDALILDTEAAQDAAQTIRRIVTLGPDAPLVALAGHLAARRMEALDFFEAGAEDVIDPGKTDPGEALWHARLAHERRTRMRKTQSDPASAARQAEERTLTVVQESPEAMLIIDHEGLVKFANEEAAALFGCAQEDMEGRPVDLPLDVTSEDVQSLTMRGTDGATRFVEARVMETNDGPVPARIATLSDVTVRRKLEDTIRRSRMQREETARRSRTFFSNVNHDLRTPLTHIIGFSEIMRDERFGPMGHASYRNYAADIHASGRMLLEMIEDLLGIADAEEGNMTLDEEICNLAQLLDIAVTSQQTACARAGIRVEIDCPPGMPGFLGDARRLRQGFFRLLSEVIHCAPAETALAIRVRSNDRNVSITVEEKPGMLSNHPEFAGLSETGNPERSFVSAEASGCPRQDGLALTLTRRVAELHGGTLCVTPRGMGQLPNVLLQFPATRMAAPARRMLV